MGEFAGGLYLAVENVCDTCAFAAGEPCYDKCIGSLDERGDGERAAGDEHDGDFVAGFLPGLDLRDVFVGAVERHVGAVFFEDDFVVKIIAAVVAEPFGVGDFADNVYDGACFFGGFDA